MICDYGELEKRWPEKGSEPDPEWDADYGWGGGRFGKRSDVSSQV